MKSLKEVEAEIAALAARIGAGADDLPTYGHSRDFGYPHVEIDAHRYHYVIVERGAEIERRSSANYGDLLFWIFSDITHGLAFAYERTHRIEDQDSRRIAFPRQIELMRRIDADMARRLEQGLAVILERWPYDDEPTRAANRLRKEGKRS